MTCSDTSKHSNAGAKEMAYNELDSALQTNYLHASSDRENCVKGRQKNTKQT